MSFFAELKRRNVLRAGALYIGAAWALSQGVAQLLPVFGFDNWVVRWFVIAAMVGFPFAMLFSWFYEWTPQGIVRESEVEPHESITRETGRKMDRWIIAVLSIAVVLLLADIFVPHRDVGGTAAVSARDKSIAVLPFVDLSPAHDQGYFSDGMAEEILYALARVKELKVIGRSSSFQYKGKDIGATRIGQALGVAHLLEGSVRRQGDQLRITATLVQTSNGEQEWSQAYDGKLADVFDLQESCARDIAAELKVALASGSGSRLVTKSSESPQAYALFVEAQTLFNRRVGDSLPRAIALLQQATVLDPNFARAWSKLAVAYAVLTQYAGGDWTANWKSSDAAAQRALVLDPNDAEAYTALSYNQFSQRHYVAMVEPMRRALQNDPDNAAANYWAANESAALGRTTDTETRIDAMLRNDPANALALQYKGFMRWRVGDVAGLLDMVRRLGSDSPFAQYLLAFYSPSIGDHQHGALQFAKSSHAMGTALTPDELEAVYRGINQGEAQRQAALKIVAAHADDDWAPTFLLQLGEPARSFAAFEQGKSGLSDSYLNWLWQPEAWSRKARQDPSFQGFAKRMGMVDYWKRYGWPDLCKPTPAAGPDAFVCR
jgi:TolB-like protein